MTMHSTNLVDAGIDALWFASDDVVSSYDARTHDSRGYRTKEAYFDDSGTGGIWFTADDVSTKRPEASAAIIIRKHSSSIWPKRRRADSSRMAMVILRA
jgi:hypothetical protein